jgi:hypothetical protein
VDASRLNGRERQHAMRQAAGHAQSQEWLGTQDRHGCEQTRRSRVTMHSKVRADKAAESDTPRVAETVKNLLQLLGSVHEQ